MRTLTLKDYKGIRTPFVFFDETGSLNDKINRFFCLGMVKCMQPFYFANNPYKAYEVFTEILLKQSIDENEILTVLADFVTTPKNIKFEVDVKHNLNESLDRLAVGGIHRVDSKGVNTKRFKVFEYNHTLEGTKKGPSS